MFCSVCGLQVMLHCQLQDNMILQRCRDTEEASRVTDLTTTDMLKLTNQNMPIKITRSKKCIYIYTFFVNFFGMTFKLYSSQWRKVDDLFMTPTNLELIHFIFILHLRQNWWMPQMFLVLPVFLAWSPLITYLSLI